MINTQRVLRCDHVLLVREVLVNGSATFIVNQATGEGPNNESFVKGLEQTTMRQSLCILQISMFTMLYMELL